MAKEDKAKANKTQIFSYVGVLVYWGIVIAVYYIVFCVVFPVISNDGDSNHDGDDDYDYNNHSVSKIWTWFTLLYFFGCYMIYYFKISKIFGVTPIDLDFTDQ